MCTVRTPRPRRLLRTHFRVADAWARAILPNPATVARRVRGKKGGVEIEAPLSIHSADCGALHLACFPKISNQTRSGIRRNQSCEIFRIKVALDKCQYKSTRQLLNRSRRLKRSRSFSMDLELSMNACEAQESRQGQPQLSFHTDLNPFGG